jgi:hypothetical protein
MSYHKFGNTTVEVWHNDSPVEDFPVGWYWWACQPGCLPDGEPIGPYGSEVEALAEAKGELDYDEPDDDRARQGLGLANMSEVDPDPWGYEMEREERKFGC